MHYFLVLTLHGMLFGQAEVWEGVTSFHAVCSRTLPHDPGFALCCWAES